MKILFCDIDGVLNTKRWEIVGDSAWIEENPARVLNSLLKAIGDCRLVITSQRRESFDVTRRSRTSILWMLHSHGIHPYAIDVTDPGTWQERPALISRYLDYADCRYAVLDDVDYNDRKGYPYPEIPSLAVVDPKIGLSWNDAAKALKFFEVKKNE